MRRSKYTRITRCLFDEAHVKRSSFSHYAGQRGTVVGHRINSNGLASYALKFKDGKTLWWTENELTPER
jgi:hypothetical protein